MILMAIILRGATIMVIRHSAIDNGSSRLSWLSRELLVIIGLRLTVSAVYMLTETCASFFFFSGFKACYRTHNSLSRDLEDAVLMLGELIRHHWHRLRLCGSIRQHFFNNHKQQHVAWSQTTYRQQLVGILNLDGPWFSFRWVTRLLILDGWRLLGSLLEVGWHLDVAL